MRLQKLVSQSAVGFIFLALVGCGNSGSTVEVSGKITYEGRPVTTGMIFFDPDKAAGNVGPQGIAEFNDGNYKTNAGVGVTPGVNTLRVELTVLPPGTKLVSDAPLPKGAVIGVYEKKVTIPAGGSTVLDIDIRADEVKR